jgi:hypothetical protein
MLYTMNNHMLLIYLNTVLQSIINPDNYHKILYENLRGVTHFSEQNDKCKHRTVSAPWLTHDCKGKYTVNAMKAHAELEIERHLFSVSTLYTDGS